MEEPPVKTIVIQDPASGDPHGIFQLKAPNDAPVWIVVGWVHPERVQPGDYFTHHLSPFSPLKAESVRRNVAHGGADYVIDGGGHAYANGLVAIVRRVA